MLPLQNARHLRTAHIVLCSASLPLATFESTSAETLVQARTRRFLSVFRANFACKTQKSIFRFPRPLNCAGGAAKIFSFVESTMLFQKKNRKKYQRIRKTGPEPKMNVV